MSDYKKPENIMDNMGGMDDVLDARLANVVELLDQESLDSLDTFLDIGMGKGQISVYLSKKGKKVTATGLELDSYSAKLNDLKQKYGINAIECGIESMPFADKAFDGIVMSHILEHCPNVGFALKEARRVMKDDGWLFLFVPPHESRVCAGHISIGWNIGQLMYVLLLNGFDVKNGKFIQYGYNVAAFVQKRLEPLPPLRYDQGDINILAAHGLFPAPIITADGNNDGYFGNLIAVNWDRSFVDKMLEKNAKAVIAKPSAIIKILNCVLKIIPRKSRVKLSQKVLTLANLIYIHGYTGKNDAASINPKVLNG